MAEPLSPAEKHRKAILYARITYALVFLSFITVCVVAVTTTMAMERDKPGFHAIRVKKPISFIDRTYLDNKPAH